MDTLEFLNSILPDDGVYYIAVFENGHRAPRHKAYESLAELAADVAKLSTNPALSVYHACGGYRQRAIEQADGSRKFRIPENWGRAKAFWMDIDCGEAKAAKGDGYTDKRTAAAAVFAFAKQIAWPKPMLVDSGNGIHAYWPLTKPIAHDKWVRVATLLKAATKHFGLLADPTATADFARILRPVGSVNRKNDAAKPVRVLHPGTQSPPEALYAPLRDVLKAAGATPAPAPQRVAETGTVNDDLIGHAIGPKIDSSGEHCANHCKQMAAMRDSRGDVGYEHWRGVIGVLKHCVDGEALAEQWSERRGTTGHSQVDWQTRYTTWNAGPSTCAFFEACNSGGCDGCPHQGKVKSPIMLGRVVPETEERVEEVKSEDGVVEQVVVPAMPTGYAWDGSYMVRALPDKDGVVHAHAFCPNLFYPTMRIRREDATFSIGLRLHLPDNRVRDFEIPFDAMASSTDLLRAFARYELLQSNHKDAGVHMMAYLRDAMEKLKREIDEVNTLTTYGWKYDMQAFLIGDRLYHKDGSVRRVLLGGYAAGKRHVFPAPKGSLEGYANPLNFIYNRPGLESMQYALCSGWGSILSPFCEDLYKGLLFSLHSGKSGTGKSTVCYNSLYAFGNADLMTLKSEDMATKNALWATVGAMNNVPILFDELTKIAPEDLSAMAYRISLGEERGRLKNTAAGTRFADTCTWRMSPFVTSNKDLHALLAMTQSNAEAELVRVVQIRLDDFNIPELRGGDLQAFQMACDRIKLNAGCAGDAIIRYCVQHVDAIYDRMRAKVLELAQDLPDAKFRFYRSHAACTLVMAEIARDLGIIKFDVAALHEFAKTLMLQMRDAVSMSTATTPEEIYSRMLSSLNNRILVTSEFRDMRQGGTPETPRRPTIGEVAGRFIVPTSTSRDPAKGRLILNIKDVREWCARNRVEVATITDYLASQGALVSTTEKLRLTRGTDVPGGQCVCIVINTLALEASESSPKHLSVVVDNTEFDDNAAA